MNELTSTDAHAMRKFFGRVREGCGKHNAAYEVGWSPQKLRKFEHDADFKQMFELSRERMLEDIEETTVRQAKAGNCVTPDVSVLTEDLQWVPAGDLQVGDFLVGFDEHRLDGEVARCYRRATVLSTGLARRDVWRLRFEDGSSVRCTPDHPWVATHTDKLQGGVGGLFWMTPPEIAHRLAKGGPGGAPTSAWVLRPIAPWGPPLCDYQAGLLAGAFDADGSLSIGGRRRNWPLAEFSQYKNPLLDAVKQALELHSFPYKEREGKIYNGRQPTITHLKLAARWNTLRFLGQVRPPRLLGNWLAGDSIEGRKFSRAGTESLRRVVSAEPDRQAEICTLSTSSGTFLTEYGATHNTVCIQMVLYGHPERGWRPPQQRIQVDSTTTHRLEVVTDAKELLRQMMLEGGVEALEQPFKREAIEAQAS